MALTKRFLLFGVKCGSTFFSQLQDGTLNTNVQDLIVTPAGHTIPIFNAANGEKPEVPFTTPQLKDALTKFGVLGDDGSTTVLTLRKMKNKGSRTPDATAEHVTYTCSSVLGYITQITAGNKRQAQAALRLILLKNGATAPFVYSGTAAISETLVGDQNYVLGPIAHNGSVLEGTNDFTCNFDIKPEEPEDDFESANSFAAVDMSEPKLSFTTTDPSIWSLHNVEITNSLKVNLIRLKKNASREADAALKHVLLKAKDGRFVCESVSGAKSLTRVRVLCNSPDGGTTAPVTATVDSAIDTAVDV